MAKILSQDEIDALLSNVSGEADTDEVIEPTQRVSIYDFKHPNLVSKEQLRLLETIHEGICRNFGVFLSAQLRMIVEMNLLAVDQIMYSEFVMSIAAPSSIYVCEIDDPFTNFVLELNPQLAIFMVEKLFGGRGNFIPEVRPISVIEQKVMKRVVDRIAAEVQKNWAKVANFNCSVNRFESNPEFVQILPSSEAVVVASMEIKIHGNSTLMNICYPYIWISNIVSSQEVQEKISFGSKESTPEERTTIEQSLAVTKVPLAPILGKTVINIGDFINLKAGDVIALKDRTEKPLSVYVENKHVFDALIGIRKQRFALRIQSVREGEEQNED